MLLVRHGETATTGVTLSGQAPGLHLADTGHRQAEALAERIGRLKTVAAVYASPLERAQETAAPIAKTRNLEVRMDAGLADGDFGQWTGMELRQLHKKPEWKLVQRHPSGFRFPGGESFTEMQARMTSTLGRLVASHPGETIVAVSHADPIRVAVAHALGAPLDLFQRVVVSTGSVTAIAYGFNGPVVLTVNSTDGDLAGLGRS
ncbi:MAG: MSMEG_4193 family putative phosphomutase [Candidatus Rokuibacteriota bacterium]